MEECLSFPSGLSFLACKDSRYNLHGCHNLFLSLSLSLGLTMWFTGYHVKLTQPHKNVQVQILMTRPTETREKTKKRGIKTSLQDPTKERRREERLQNGSIERQSQNSLPVRGKCHQFVVLMCRNKRILLKFSRLSLSWHWTHILFSIGCVMRINTTWHLHLCSVKRRL